VVRGGDTLVIGGQVVRKRINQRSSLPIIGQLPLIGDLLSSRSNEMAQFVRIYVVRPRLLGEDSSFAGNAMPQAQEDTFSHPSVGQVNDIIRRSSLTPNRQDASAPSRPPEVNRDAPRETKREAPVGGVTQPVTPQSMLVPAPMQRQVPQLQPDAARTTP